MPILFSIYTMLHQKMPLPMRFASAVSLGHCHYDTAELVFIHERERNTSAEGSPSPLYLTAWINFASSLHLSSRIACLWANIQAKLGWSPRYRALAHKVFLCSVVFKAISQVKWQIPSLCPKNLNLDKGVWLCIAQYPKQKCVGFTWVWNQRRKTKCYQYKWAGMGKLASRWKALVWSLISSVYPWTQSSNLELGHTEQSIMAPWTISDPKSSRNSLTACSYSTTNLM